MPWAKIDEKYHSHPKALRVGLAGIGLHVRAIAYSNDYETDGTVTEDWVHQQTASEGLQGLEDKLVDVELFERCDGGFIVHDFLKYNPSREQNEAHREGERQRKAASRDQGGRRGGSTRKGGP